MVPVKLPRFFLCLAAAGLLSLSAFGRDWGEMNSPERGERMMKAFAAAYPGAVERAEFRGGDWAVLLRGRWFYWAEGRLLPDGMRDQSGAYAPHSFYAYFPDLPPWKEPEPELAGRLKNVLKNRRANPPKRYPDFFDTLWEARTREEARQNLRTITFLDRTFPVHRALVEKLAKVEARIRAAAKTDPDVDKWIKEIGSIGAWNWRNVAATVSRSYHSYAAALDIQPARLRGLQTYWQWTADNNPQWYLVPYSGRYHPPDAVVKAFEAYGFCWGGKWPLFDTMHFEYRPEIMKANNLPLED
ncbi:MAG: M15 family metallopeptidase [Treponema sp.]|jgi:hypothetical protein|nr:M15 family metallopeptidase [Treponema sp.]